MKLTKSFFKSTKGVIIIVLGILFVVFGVIGALATAAYNKVSQSDSTFPVMALTDALSIAFDEQKLTHLYQSELAMVDAFRAARADNYDKMHRSFDTAVDEMSEAVGENSALTCSIISIQSMEEGGFGKLSIVEDLERRIIKSLPKSKQCKALLALSKARLRWALENQGKYDLALSAHNEELAYAEKNDSSADKAELHESLQALAQFYEKFQVYDKAFQTYERLLLLDRALPASEKKNSQIAWVLREEADLKCKTREFPQAIALFAKSIDLEPSVSSKIGRAHV